MKLIVQIPDDLIEAVKGKLPPPQVGILEAIASGAIMGFLHRLETSPNWMAAVPDNNARRQ